MAPGRTRRVRPHEKYPWLNGAVQRCCEIRGKPEEKLALDERVVNR